MVGRGKVDLHPMHPLNDLVALELCAVVQRDGLDRAGHSGDGSAHGRVSLLRGARGYLLDHREADLPIDQRQHAVPLV